MGEDVIFHAFILTLSLIHVETPPSILLLQLNCSCTGVQPTQSHVTPPLRFRAKLGKDLGKKNCPGNFCSTVKRSSCRDQEPGFKLQRCHLLYDFRQVLNWSSSFLFCKMGIIKKHHPHNVMRANEKMKSITQHSAWHIVSSFLLPHNPLLSEITPPLLTPKPQPMPFGGKQIFPSKIMMETLNMLVKYHMVAINKIPTQDS